MKYLKIGFNRILVALSSPEYFVYNEGAKIVRTEAGAYLAMASDMSIRRYCHMHKFTYTKKCERPKCDRFIFPQLHPEAEIIGKAVFYPGNNSKEMCDKMVKRVDHSLF